MAWPYTFDNQFGLPSLPTLGGLGQQAAPRMANIPLPQAEEDSALSKLGSGLLSGLQWVGQSLDKALGARALRGVLGGHNEELLSLIPFSDTIGITDPANIVSGEDLARQSGLLEGEGQKGEFELRDLLGPAIEIGLDPGTYLSFGASALSKAGQAAKKAGTLGKTTASRIAQGQGGLAKIGLPFTDIGTEIGTGPIASKIAAGMGKVGDAVKYGNIPGTSFSPGAAVSGLFDKTVEGTTDPFLQQALRSREGMAAGRIGEAEFDLAQRLRRIHDAGELSPSTSGNIRDALEGSLVGPLQSQTQAEVDSLRQLLQSDLPLREGMIGLPTNPIADYAPRQMTPLDKATKGYGGSKPTQPLSAFNPHQLGREEIFAGMPTRDINENIKSVLGLGPDANQFAARDLIAERLGMGPAEWDNLWNLEAKLRSDAGIGDDLVEGMTKADTSELSRLRGIAKQSEGFADWARNLDPQYAQHDFFGNNIFTDLSHRLSAGIRSEERAKSAFEAIGKAAAPLEPGMVGMSDVIKSIGLTESALPHIAQKLGVDAKDIFKFGVPREQAQSLGKYVQSFVKPEAMGPLLQAYDSILNLTKAGLTAVWPAKYARDFSTNVYMNWVHDVFDPTLGKMNPAAWVKPYTDAKTLFRDGGTMAGAAQLPMFAGKNLTDQAASKQLIDMAHAMNIAGTRKLTGAVESTGSRHAAEQILRVPEEGVRGIKQALGEGTWNPLDIAGVGGRKSTKFKLASAGTEVTHLFDDLSRGAAWIAKLKQGFDPQEAARVATRAQYDYANLSKFEKSTMKRLVPFYNFARQNIPEQIKQLAERPGGKLAQSIRVTNDLNQQQGGFVPDYLKEKLGIPIGTEDSGTQRFLTGFGLPFEEAFAGLPVSGRNPVGRMLESIMGSTAPMIKAPLELMAGRQFFSGRDIGDLYGSTGSPVLDQIIYNSPLSRGISSARTLIDERKGPGAKALNLLTGVKLSDVDMDKQRSIAIRKAIEDKLKGQEGVRSFEQLYVPAANEGLLSPEEMALLRLYRSMDAKKKKPVGVSKS